MALKIVTNFSVLCNKARTLAKAKEMGDLESIKEAQEDHDGYRELCLESDEMTIDLSPINRR